MSSSSDYGDEGDWTNSMEEELQKQELLATTAGQLDTKPVDTFAPEIPIQAEDVFVSQDVLDDAALQAELLGEELYKDSRSLLERFRKKGSLSVTDFCSPSFCETKFCYSLLGRRDLSPSQRPTHIARADGVKIEVNQAIAVAADKVLQRGKEIHHKLEQEIQLDTVFVQTTSRAEALCLRLLNLVVSLNQLKEDGLAREVPIFGFVDGILVRGVIDEIEKRPLQLDPTPEDLAKDKGKLDHYFSPSKASKKPAKPTHGYTIVDHKTRFGQKMPGSIYSKPYRVQLMLYKKLFDTLAKDEFDWNKFLAVHNVEKETMLSDHFIIQIIPIFFSISNFVSPPAEYSVNSICEVLRTAFLCIGPLQDILELIYRSRTAKKKKKKTKKVTAVEPVVLDDEADIAADGVPAPVEDEIESQATVPVALATPKTSQASTVSAEEEVGRIIGTEKFHYDESLLDAWCVDMLAFWRSEREVRGVDVEDVGYKCRSCEFESGCEYLEGQAKKHAEERAMKKQKT